MTATVLVIGVGQPYRGDDAAGLEAAAHVSGAEVMLHHGEGLGLMALWEGYDAVILIDAAESGAPPGTLHRFDATDPNPLPARLFRTSSHAFGVHEAIETARTLGRLPEQMIVHAVEGADWTLGAPLTPEVRSALPSLIAAVEDDVRACAPLRAMP